MKNYEHLSVIQHSFTIFQQRLFFFVLMGYLCMVLYYYYHDINNIIPLAEVTYKCKVHKDTNSEQQLVSISLFS